MNKTIKILIGVITGITLYFITTSCSTHSEVRVIECPKGTMVAEDGTMKFKSYDSIVKEWQELKFEQSKWIFWRDNHKY